MGVSGSGEIGPEGNAEIADPSADIRRGKRSHPKRQHR